MTHTKPHVFCFLSLISHFVLHLHSYKIWKIERCKYWQFCQYILGSVSSAVNCQCQPLLREYEPSNSDLIFLLVHSSKKKTRKPNPKNPSLDLVPLLTTAKVRPSLACLAVSNFFSDSTVYHLYIHSVLSGRFVDVRLWAHCEPVTCGHS